MSSMKDNKGKNMTRLILPGFLWEMGEVLSHGARKYKPYGWLEVSVEEYKDSLGRHYLKSQSHRNHDEETGLSHYAHLAVNAMFLWYFKINPSGVDSLLTTPCECPYCTGEKRSLCDKQE